MGKSVLLVSGYGGGEGRAPGLAAALAAAGQVWTLPPGANTDAVRGAYAQAAKGGKVSVVGLGAGWVQALMLAQAFEVARLACVFPWADGRAGPMVPRRMALGNLFAVLSPALVVDRPATYLGKRIYQGIGARDKRYIVLDGDEDATQAILEHLCPIPATHSLANQHNLGII